MGGGRGVAERARMGKLARRGKQISIGAQLETSIDLAVSGIIVSGVLLEHDQVAVTLQCKTRDFQMVNRAVKSCGNQFRDICGRVIG